MLRINCAAQLFEPAQFAAVHSRSAAPSVFLPPMCERYVIASQAEVEREFRVVRPWWRFSASFNVAPSRTVPVVRMHEGETEGVMLRWGLVPEWAEGDSSRKCAAHASSEHLEGSDIVRAAWSRGRRCILPLAGFYGWWLTPARYRQPYFVRLVDRDVCGIAALWDRTVAQDEDDVIESCAMLTVPANSLITGVDTTAKHMPAILRPEDHETWLSGSPSEARSVLRAYPGDQMTAYNISPRINSLKHDDAWLIHPVAQDIQDCA